MSTIKMCNFCEEIIDIAKPSLDLNFVCNDCFNDRDLCCSLFYAQKIDVPKSELKTYRSADCKHWKYCREEIDKYLINNETLFLNASQSDIYGMMSEKERKHVINNFCKYYKLDKKKVMQDNAIEYFIKFGLLVGDDHTFFTSIKCNKSFHTNSTTRYKTDATIDLMVNDFTD